MGFRCRRCVPNKSDLVLKTVFIRLRAGMKIPHHAKLSAYVLVNLLGRSVANPISVVLKGASLQNLLPKRAYCVDGYAKGLETVRSMPGGLVQAYEIIVFPRRSQPVLIFVSKTRRTPREYTFSTLRTTSLTNHTERS
jgi:hypothetical protein